MDFADYRSEPTPGRHVLTWLVKPACRLLMRRLNHLQVEGLDRLERAQAADRGLITFSNHVSLFDDPWLPGAVVRGGWRDMRWCATDDANFFTHPLSRRFFSAGKGVPIVRGAGLDQPGMHFLEDRLRDGDWVHIFPEGGRSRDPHQLRTPLKTGLAHLVQATAPLLLPYHHWGMEEVLPIGARLPRLGKHVQLRFGEITDSRDDLAQRSIDEITRWAEDQLTALQSEARAAARQGG